MPEAEVELDVLIVGAGPVGLFLANECARRGLRWRIVEARPGQSIHSKALAIFPRTLEIFDMAGIVAPFLEAANRVTAVSVTAHGRRLAQMRFEPEETPYPFVAMVPQDVTEKLLVSELRRQGGAVGYETSFVSAEPSDGAMRAVLEHGGERTAVSAAFLVGCDGAHSAVRHGLAIPFEGAAYEDAFLLADVETNEALPADELQLCPSEHGPAAIFPMSAVRRRIVATVGRPEGDAPSLELVRRILAERAPRELVAKALHWSSYFRIHHRHVAHLRAGRTFLAGDAAHIHSPFGGQGMNTGLHDVWNLVWKLDLVLHGRGNERLLDSYETERLPVIRNVIAMTDAMTRVLGTPNRLAQALRDAVIPMVSRLAPFQHAFVRRLSELGVAYPESPIVEGPGTRYLDDTMRGGGGVGSRFLLLLPEDAGPAERAAAEGLGRSRPDVLEFRRTARPGVALVRPDGYVAYSTSALGDEELGEVRAVLELQTSPGAERAGGPVSPGGGSGRTPPSS
jgi:2-polyprenyl-6-methoxyphenol hydroxylase-like FAD-dependent oxidoreductase